MRVSEAGAARWRLGTCLAATMLAALAGCATVGPEYHPPELSVPDAWHAPLPALLADARPLEQWWQLFADPVLDDLVTRGLYKNLDIAEAASRVREARALARGVDADRAPRLDGGADAELEAATRSRSRGGDDGVSAGFGAFLDGELDLDLYGGLQRESESAAAAAERQLALYQEARRQTTAEIARNYVSLRAAERRLALTRDSLALQRRTVALVSERVKAGLAPRLDQVRAEASVATLVADLGPLVADVGRFSDALSVLLGEPPGPLALAVSADDAVAIPSAKTGSPLPMPAELLRRRPDLRAAELAIIAATADVGVATAALYPSLVLPGRLSVGRDGIGAGTLVTAVLATLSPVLTLPLLDGGGREADVEAAEQRLAQASLAYRNTLLNALREVEAALLDYRGAEARRQSLSLAAEKNEIAYTQSQALYRQGLTTFIDVLDSQREFNSSLQSLAEAERDLALDVIDLYTALGGEGSSGALREAPPG